ncbi:chitinase [Streptacidiphilus sp. BW17]|uniref:chitinase n=1 Tax=Streptacidiphilus sp. BW17 TaxID=3156274 RepID=UPI00351100F4
MRRLGAMLPATAVATLLTAGTLVVTAGTGHASTTAALGSNWYGSAPYYYTLDSSAPDLGQVMSATGQKAFELAFVLAPNGGGCTPTWDGTDPVSSDTQVAAVVNEVRADGGDVSVSAGGYGGTKLGQECGTPAATAAAYQQVISAYGLHAIDFDLEEPEIENSTAINNELGAAQILQANNPGLYVSVTIPSTTSGANYFGQQLLDNAKTLGFTPDNYSIMPFDGGFSGAASQITALQDFNTQLTNTFGWSSATAYAHEGVSGMNGRTDSAEYFYQSDFQTVLNFAESNGMSRYTFWDVNRDRECNPPNNNGNLSGECSSVTQNAYDFTKYTAEFAGATPPTPSPTPTPTATPTPTPTPTSTSTSGGGGSCAAAWSASTAYTAGQQVSYNGHNWTANQWNDDEAPGGPSGAWNDDGTC